MSRKPGIIYELPDGRKVIAYKDQPLKKENKFVLHLIDDNFKEVIDDKTKKQKTIIKNRNDFKLLMQDAKYIGLCD